MVNTTRASMMAQICELKHFGIITGKEEQIMIKKVEDWNVIEQRRLSDAKVNELNNSQVHKKMMAEVNKIANDILNE